MKRTLLVLSLVLCFAACNKNELAPTSETLNPVPLKAAPIPPDFTIALLPDLQFMTDPGDEGGLEAMFTAQIKWIMDNRAAENIVYVGGLGDVSDSGDGSWSDPQWTVVERNFYGNKTGYAKGLETPLTGFPYGIPYGMVTGNHDQRTVANVDGTPSSACTKYNSKLGRSHFANTAHPYYGGSYTTSNSNNFWTKFSVGVAPNKMDFVVININYDLDHVAPALTDWAYSIATQNVLSKVIVITHNMCDTNIPAVFSTQGLAIWNKLKGLDNVFMFAGGHITGSGYREDTFDNCTIKTFQSDFQGWSLGGKGYFRLMKFSAANNLISVRTYSAWENYWLTSSANVFTKPWLDAPSPTPIADGKYKIVARNTGSAAKVLVISGASTANSAPVVLGDYTSAAPTNDEWNITKIATSPGYYRISNVNSGKDMNIQGKSIDNSALVIQYPYVAGDYPNDEFKIVDVGSGYYKIIARHDAKCLNVQGNATTNGTNIIQYNYTNVPQSQFAFVAIP